MKQYNKVLAGSIIAGALALAPLAFAADTTIPVAPTAKPETKVLPNTASAKAKAAVNKAKSATKKVDTKAEAGKKNQVKATDPSIIKKMEATKGTKQAEAEAKMKAQLEAMKAKAPVAPKQ